MSGFWHLPRFFLSGHLVIGIPPLGTNAPPPSCCIIDVSAGWWTKADSGGSYWYPSKPPRLVQVSGVSRLVSSSRQICCRQWSIEAWSSRFLRIRKPKVLKCETWLLESEVSEVKRHSLSKDVGSALLWSGDTFAVADCQILIYFSMVFVFIPSDLSTAISIGPCRRPIICIMGYH